MSSDSLASALVCAAFIPSEFTPRQRFEVRMANLPPKASLNLARGSTLSCLPQGSSSPWSPLQCHPSHLFTYGALLQTSPFRHFSGIGASLPCPVPRTLSRGSRFSTGSIAGSMPPTRESQMSVGFAASSTFSTSHASSTAAFPS